MTKPDIHPDASTIGASRKPCGMGAAPSGSGAWLAERLTSISLVPLTLWFIVSVLSLGNADRADINAWLNAPVPLVLLLCLIVATFWHMELGLRVVIDDYVHNDLIRRILLLSQRGVCILVGASSVIATLSLGLSESGG